MLGEKEDGIGGEAAVSAYMVVAMAVRCRALGLRYVTFTGFSVAVFPVSAAVGMGLDGIAFLNRWDGWRLWRVSDWLELQMNLEKWGNEIQQGGLTWLSKGS